MALEEPPRDDFGDVFPLDDAAPEPPDPGEGPRGKRRACVDCGGSGGGRDGCEHREIAHFEAPTRAVEEAIARLRRAAAEHRAASRALRALVMTEVARGRAELETAPAATPDPLPPALPPPLPSPPEPCPRCAEQAAEAEAVPGAALRVARRRPRAVAGQQAFVFMWERDPSAP